MSCVVDFNQPVDLNTAQEIALFLTDQNKVVFQWDETRTRFIITPVSFAPGRSFKVSFGKRFVVAR